MITPLLSAAALLSAASTAAARPSPGPPHSYPHQPGSGSHNGQCTTFNLPVPVKTVGVDFGFPPATNKYEVTQWAVSGSTWTTPSSPEAAPFLPNVTIKATFNIFGHLCVPRNGAKKEILHLATHGLIFDSRYWDVPIDPAQYSYVYNALEAGYSVLTYDRLTTGQSDKPDGYVTAQGATEVEILRGITKMARSGEIYDHIGGFAGKTKFESIVHVGHSFGSFITNALLALDGTLSDGAILTGFIPTSHAGLLATTQGLDFARTNDPKFADRPDAYIVPARDIDVQTGFFSALANKTLGIGGFDPALLELANNTKQPGTLAEFATLPLLTLYGPAEEFTGPVQFMEGEFDYIICGGDCHDWDQAAIDATWVNAKDVEVYLQPGTGHGMPMHRNANTAFQVTFDFLARNGL